AQFEHPVALVYNGYGDRLLTLPTVRALANLWLGRLTLIGETGDDELFYADVPLRRFVGLSFHRDPLEQSGGWLFDYSAVVSSLHRADSLFLPFTWTSTSIARLVQSFSSAKTYGFSASLPSRLLYPRNLHAADATFRLASSFSPSLNIEAHSQPP